MGLFEKIFARPPRPQGTSQGFFKTFNGYIPAFRSWGGSIYEQELVRSAIHATATHVSKLEVGAIGAAKPHLQSLLRQGPNEFQTWSQFLYRLATILEVKNTAIIAPVFDQYGDISGFYPVIPDGVELVQYAGEPWIRMELNGKKAAVELKLVGIMTKFQFKDDFFGESNKALDPTMSLISIQNQGIQEGVKSSATYRFMAKLNNFTSMADLKKERKEFSAENLSGHSDAGGLLLFPNKYTDIEQIKSQPFVVDAEQMRLIQNNVFSYFGVNEKIIQNSAMGDELDAFYNGKIEAIAIQLSDVLTRMVFTSRERAVGARIQVSANRLQYMTTTAKISMATQLGDRGMIMIDEIRALFNYPPLPDGAGQKAPIRGEYFFNGEEGKEDDET